MTTIPNLERHCGSWVIVKSDGTALLETYSRSTAADFALRGYEVATAAQWLARVNSQVSA